jgi:hypothetical protein
MSLALILCLGVLAVPDESALSLTDLSPYRAALEAGSGPSVAGEPVTFRDLWERPEAYEGRRVRVEGRVVRRFRQPAVGRFPPLTELWIVADTRDPFCLVFPTAEAPESLGEALSSGERVRFEGTYLKTIRYAGADEPRLAPLIVGPQPPVISTVDPLADILPRREFAALDWAVGLIVGGLVVLLLLRQTMVRPIRQANLPSNTPAPPFIDQPED